jgi:hypothetical protein
MSRRKDRERFLQMIQLNPDYKGFRGGMGGAGVDAPLETIICSICGRRRNVAIGIALEQRESYVCLSCREESGDSTPENPEP